MGRTAIQTIAGAAAAAVAAIALSAVTNWRLALLTSVIAAAIAATRMRYARLVALALLALVLGLASAGLSAGSDERTAAHTASAVHCAAVSSAREGQVPWAASLQRFCQAGPAPAGSHRS